MNSCYVDSSVVLQMAMEQDGYEQTQERYDAVRDRGDRLISSQLLELECRRTQIREGDKLSWDAVQPYLDSLDILFALSAADWHMAMHGIPYHVKSLDALHLAACINAAAVLLSSDDGLNDAAGHMGVELA